MFQKFPSTPKRQEDNMPAPRMREFQRQVMTRELGQRQARMGLAGSFDKAALKLASRKVPRLFTERELALEGIDKIFAASWLNERQVVMGSKCNKLIVLDALSGRVAEIPSIQSSDDSRPAESPCGIHAISINPSRSLLATGGHNTNDLAIYKLPTLDPACTAERGHGDYIFDVKWLDDEFVVSSSRDGSLCLWRIKDSDMPEQRQSRTSELFSLPDMVVEHPLATRKLKENETARALAVNQENKEIAGLSPNGAVYIWDIKTLRRTIRFKPHGYVNNVCMSKRPGHSTYAFGSRAHVEMLDPRARRADVVFTKKGCDVRSVNFQGDMLTIGTDSGTIFFLDLRTHRVVPCRNAWSLVAGRGWLLRDVMYRTFVEDMGDYPYPNAIYTHCFDETGTKLFAAGGPSVTSLYGNYAGIWE